VSLSLSLVSFHSSKRKQRLIRNFRRSDDSFQHLKNALLDRVRDKESSVRLQAVVALSKLQEADEDDDSDDSDEEDEEKKSVSEVLIDIMNHDSAA